MGGGTEGVFDSEGFMRRSVLIRMMASTNSGRQYVAQAVGDVDVGDHVVFRTERGIVTVETGDGRFADAVVVGLWSPEGCMRVEK